MRACTKIHVPADTRLACTAALESDDLFRLNRRMRGKRDVQYLGSGSERVKCRLTVFDTLQEVVEFINPMRVAE